MAKTSHGTFVWYENLTRDAKAAIAFYSDVLGWKTQPFDDTGHYTMWVSSQGPLGGVMQLTPETNCGDATAGPLWMGHVQVDDVVASVARLRKMGGKVFKDPTPIPQVGSFAVVADPQGASLSLFQPSRDMPAHDASKPGEVCWRELITTDHKAGFAFYSELLGWKILDDMDMGPMGTYRVFGIGDERLGGMMTVANKPPRWQFYFQTDALEAALKRATGRGAKLLSGPMEIPGGARIAEIQDPLGAVFALHEMKR